ncbi:MAG: M1 family peptidase [Lysobacteraceae bacterium]|nr:MAG: M1 family peptidase [Xanthomonadaceae bacterium]
MTLPRLALIAAVLIAPTAYAAPDPNSYANSDQVRVRKLALDLAVDFDKHEIAGTASLQLDWKDPSARELVLDTRDLTIEKVEAFRIGGGPYAAKFRLDPRDPMYGSALHIELDGPAPEVRIRYRTAPTASGLQWMGAELTANKKHPFLFSQSQAIHARSWVPLQDTPGVRFTYSARIKAPKALRVVMSADNDAKHALDGDFRFEMKQPIPSYLLAIAVGDLDVRETGPRTAVYAEPSVVEKAAKEFEDTEKMIVAAEKLYGPYRWDRYDLLVLPASFPFGGMENPRLTFATPTVIVGDKSLTSLIAHELAHSWSGNLVTNSTWKDIWLNEGFTTYVEGRIVEAVFGREQTEMEEVISQFGLAQDMKTMEPFAQRLALDPLLGRDPDEALSDIAYIKGAWFLQFLERRIGRAEFDAFLRGYFDAHAFQSIDSATFAAYAKDNLLAKHPGKVSEAEFDAWLHAPGIPSIAEPAHSARFDVVDAARADWLAGERAPSDIATGKWSTQEWVRFLEGMPEKLAPAQLAALDAAVHFTGTPNGEIAMRWYPLAVRSGYAEARPAMETFLVGIGRRKLVMPTWQALAATPGGLAFARGVLAKAKPGMHPITASSVESTLDKAKP